MRSHRRLTRVVVLPLVLTLSVLVACSSAVVAAATVNGYKIKRSDFQRELEALKANKGFVEQLTQQGGAVVGENDETISANLAAGWLTQLITIRLIEEEFERRDLKITAEARKTAGEQVPQQFGGPEIWEKFPKWFRDRMIERIARVSAVEKAFTTAPTEEKDIKKYFDANPGEFDQFCASHILVETEDEANAIATQLAGSGEFAALAFANIAKEKSTDTGSGAEGGALGCKVKSTYVKPFADALASAELNKATKPVKSEFGYHLILVTERKPANYEEQKEEIATVLGQQSQQAIADFFTKAIEKAKVDVDPRYGKVEKTPEGIRVVPPVVTQPSDRRQDTPTIGEDPAGLTGPVGSTTTP